MLDLPRGHEALECVRPVLVGCQCVQTLPQQEVQVRLNTSMFYETK